MQIDPTFDSEGNELAEKIIEERANLKLLRILIKEMDWSHRIALVQIACNQIGNLQPQLIKLKPMGEFFDDQLQTAIVLMGPLAPETLNEIALEILEELSDPNE